MVNHFAVGFATLDMGCEGIKKLSASQVSIPVYCHKVGLHSYNHGKIFVYPAKKTVIYSPHVHGEIPVFNYTTDGGFYHFTNLRLSHIDTKERDYSIKDFYKHLGVLS